MDTQLNPHLNFKDNARQAMTFYHSIFGGDLRLSTYKEFHASQDPSEDEKIMHAELDTGKGILFMAADTPNRMDYQPPTGFSLALIGSDEKELTSVFEKLSRGGTISMPLGKAPWGATFGMCTDQFGINWMVNIAAPKQ
jgi:PhnB protein